MQHCNCTNTFCANKILSKNLYHGEEFFACKCHAQGQYQSLFCKITAEMRPYLSLNNESFHVHLGHWETLWVH